MNRALRTAAATGALDSKLTRYARSLAEKMPAGQVVTHGAARQLLHSRYRKLYDDIVEHGAALRLWTSADDGITVLLPRQEHPQ